MKPKLNKPHQKEIIKTLLAMGTVGVFLHACSGGGTPQTGGGTSPPPSTTPAPTPTPTPAPTPTPTPTPTPAPTPTPTPPAPTPPAPTPPAPVLMNVASALDCSNAPGNHGGRSFQCNSCHGSIAPSPPRTCSPKPGFKLP